MIILDGINHIIKNNQYQLRKGYIAINTMLI